MSQTHSQITLFSLVQIMEDESETGRVLVITGVNAAARWTASVTHSFLVAGFSKAHKPLLVCVS